MKIIRNNVEIMLTSDEVRNIYEYYKHQCLIEDARKHFVEWVENAFAEGSYFYEYPRDIEECDELFQERYGFSCLEVLDENHDHYLLEKFVQLFEKNYSCNEEENAVWEYTISQVMSELPERGCA